MLFKHQKFETTILSDLIVNKPLKFPNKKDISLLRDLAKKIKDISQTSENVEKIKLWKDHNSLKKKRPLILCFPENSYKEILPYGSLKIVNPFLREYEWYLRSLIYHGEELKDDYVVTSRLKVPLVFNITSWGFSEKSVTW